MICNWRHPIGRRHSVCHHILHNFYCRCCVRHMIPRTTHTTFQLLCIWSLFNCCVCGVWNRVSDREEESERERVCVCRCIVYVASRERCWGVCVWPLYTGVEECVCYLSRRVTSLDRRCVASLEESLYVCLPLKRIVEVCVCCLSRDGEGFICVCNLSRQVLKCVLSL